MFTTWQVNPQQLPTHKQTQKLPVILQAITHSKQINVLINKFSLK